MDGVAVAITSELARSETKHAHEIVIRGFEVGVYEDRNPSLDRRVEHRHRLQDTQELVARWAIGFVQGSEQLGKPRSQLCRRFQPAVELVEVGGHGASDAPS